MAIFRGVGGSGDSSDNSFLQEVTAQANAASASAVLAQASANSILTLTAATGDAGTNVSYNASTGVLTVPRGADGTDASVTAADVTGVLTGGTGISIASNGTITNDSPDQTVALAGTGATTITGTYPNFTINSVNTTYIVGDGGLTTNDFTDDDHTKLNGIEASADVTNTTNVTAAGALMDSEVNNLAQVKAFDSSDYLTTHQDISGKANLSGATFTGDVLFNDGVKAKFGTDSDLLIYHNNGEPSVIEDAGELGLLLKTNGNAFAVISDTNESMITAVPDGGVTLYYDGTPKVTVSEDTVTISNDLSVQTGNDLNVLGGDLDVTGDIVVSGTVDGRDVAADGAKLDTLITEHSFYNILSHAQGSTQALTTTLTTVGYTAFDTPSGLGSAHIKFSLDLIYYNVNYTNDAEFIVSVTAPNPSNEAVVDLGAVTATTSTASYITEWRVAGDVTKHLSTYCGLSKGSNTGGASMGVIYNYRYSASQNVTFISTGTYNNLPSVGDHVYLHPFDWEASNTVINGALLYKLDGTTDSIVEMRRDFKQSLGYFTSAVPVSIKARRLSSSGSNLDNVIVDAIQGKTVKIRN